MEKKHAFLVAFLITLVVVGTYLFFNAGNIFPERERVVITRVLDGDTVEIEDERIIRLLNINTPERGRAFSEDATNFLKSFEGEVVELEEDGVGSYGRILGRLYDVDSGEYINLKIIELGLAHTRLVKKNELSLFKNVEKKAREKELGIWKRSEENDGCIEAEINKHDEFVFIVNRCGSLIGWTLKDESTNQYKLENVVNEEFTLYSESGLDNKKEGSYYWGRGKAWNDDKDVIFIRDEKGYLVYYDSYGY